MAEKQAYFLASKRVTSSSTLSHSEMRSIRNYYLLGFASPANLITFRNEVNPQQKRNRVFILVPYHIQK